MASTGTGNGNRRLRGRLVHTKIDSYWNQSCCKYMALSYVWGSPDLSLFSVIDIGEVECRITQNLAECLFEQLQARGAEAGPLLLWIDAICINQSDVQEKSVQVGLMPRIYSSAESVIVWLGRQTDESRVGVDILEYLSCEEYPSQKPPWSRTAPDVALAGLSDIMNRPWFQRIWVVQEAVLARKVVITCGPRSFMWNPQDSKNVRRFGRMIKYAEISPSWEQAGLCKVNMQPLLELLDLQTGQQLDRAHGISHRTSHDLLDMAHSLRHRLSSDRRDMLFAVAGMAEDGYCTTNYRPDYRWSTEHAYQHLLECIIW